MNVILTTCKNRRQHLAISAESWHVHLPGWVPMLVAVDDPEAVELLGKIYGDKQRLIVPTHHTGFSRLAAIAAGVRALPIDCERVALFDADIVALLGTSAWLEVGLDREFQICGPIAGGIDARDDLGVLLAPSTVIWEAFDLLGDIPERWEGYGWEDILIRAACWLVTKGQLVRRPVAWAHIPHSDRERMAAYGPNANLRELSVANYERFRADLVEICAPFEQDPESPEFLGSIMFRWQRPGRRVGF